MEGKKLKKIVRLSFSLLSLICIANIIEFFVVVIWSSNEIFFNVFSLGDINVFIPNMPI